MPIRLQALEQLREKQAEIDAASDHNAILQLENQVLQECSTHLQNKVSDLKKNLEHARQREAAAQKELASKDESGNALRAALRVSRMQLEASESLLEVKRTQGGLQRKRKKKKKKKDIHTQPVQPLSLLVLAESSAAQLRRLYVGGASTALARQRADVGAGRCSADAATGLWGCSCSAIVAQTAAPAPARTTGCKAASQRYGL